MKRRTLARLVVALGVVASLAGAGAAYSSHNPDDDPDGTIVYGGGRFGPGCFSGGSVCFEQPRDFSLDAHVERKGAKVYGTLFYGGNASGGGGFRGTVKCVRVDGNVAVVGGIVTPAVAGTADGFVFYVEANGSPGNGPRDRASALLADPLDAPTWPAGFPSVCPAANSNALGVGFQELHSGDVAIHVETN